MSKSLSYCGELALTHDHNRYLCALFAPADIREAWFALFAFHYEIAHIARSIGEEMVGFVRYAWWRETLDAVFKGAPPRGHPVAEALAATVKTYRLPREPFDAIIDAHEQALVEKQELDKAFLEATSGSVMQLCYFVIPVKAGISGQGEEVPAFAGTTQITALGTALAAVEAAGLRSMDKEHRPHFMALAREQLAQAANPPRLLKPFADTVRYYLAKGPQKRHGSLGLTLTLWRRHLLG